MKLGRSDGGMEGVGRTTGAGRFRKRTTLVDSPAEADVGTAEAAVTSEGRLNDRAEGVDSTSDCGCGPSWPESVQPQPTTIILEASWRDSGDGKLQGKRRVSPVRATLQLRNRSVAEEKPTLIKDHRNPPRRYQTRGGQWDGY